MSALVTFLSASRGPGGPVRTELEWGAPWSWAGVGDRHSHFSRVCLVPGALCLHKSRTPAWGPWEPLHVAQTPAIALGQDPAQQRLLGEPPRALSSGTRLHPPGGPHPALTPMTAPGVSPVSTMSPACRGWWVAETTVWSLGSALPQGLPHVCPLRWPLAPGSCLHTSPRGALATSLGFLLFWRQAGGPPQLSRAALRAPFLTGCVEGMGKWGYCPLAATPKLCPSWGSPAKCRVEPAEPAPAPRHPWGGEQRSDSIWLGAWCSCGPGLGGPPADRSWTDPGTPLRGPVCVHLGQFSGREVTG